MNILVITTEWPDAEKPFAVPFLVQHIEILKQNGIHVNVFSFKGKRKLLYYLKGWWKIRKQPYWKNAEIIHAHWGQSAFLSLFSKKKLIISYHGSDLHGIIKEDGTYSLSGKFLRLFSQLIALKANHCIIVSAHLRKFLPRKLKNVSVIPIGINLENFYPMNKLKCRHLLNLDERAKYILFASDPKRLEKRFDLATKAVDYYNEQNDGENLQLLVANKIPYSQMPFYYNAVDALILTSCHEGSPTVIKEALACCIPIVSFDVGDVADRIKEIPGSYLCQDQTIDELRKGLQIVLCTKDRPECQSYALSQIDERKNIQKVISIYRQISIRMIDSN